MAPLDSFAATTTADAPLELESATTMGRSASTDKGFAPPRRRASQGEETALLIDPRERGDARLRDQSRLRTTSAQQQTTPTSPADGEAIRLRSELARDLIGRIDAMLPLIGTVSLATALNLLKRDLSRCHDRLARHSSESGFLSLIVLVESALAQTSWKQYTAERLAAVRSAFEIGYRQPNVTFADCTLIRRSFSSAGIETTPSMDLAVVQLDECTDGQEE